MKLFQHFSAGTEDRDRKELSQNSVMGETGKEHLPNAST
jgi:hypothetical protein